MYYNEKHNQIVISRGDNYTYICSYKCNEITIDNKNKKMNKVSIIYRIFGFLFLIISIHGCQIDNYDEPSSLLKGHVVYEGKPIGVKATGGTVQLQLWQSGYGTETPIAVNVAQDGSYSIMLFDGE